ncbi:hypothetical protein GH714_041071 [Hevea brasiliensis]|uniref:Glycolipid transfer protein domain-containing protein n=1 Tax=Hevea brasiliensis TaxID=3981 RepID=A0A6A6MZB4_HEVBR|nr:hypothetical protein GH714_041071 [Hevea brasiliensis]
MLDLEVANGTVRTPGSHSRNLRRVRQGIDLIRALFEQFLATGDYSLKDAATTAYSQVGAPYHTWAVRTAVYAGISVCRKEYEKVHQCLTSNTLISFTFPGISAWIGDLYRSGLDK